MELFGDLAEQYADFGRDAAAESACFAAWSAGVAEDAAVLAWLDALPRVKQQPNLVFAAARWHGVPAPGPYAGLRSALLEDAGPIRSTILARSTQTNEVGRLATLTPAFSALAGREPIALLEVGASAGLCLYPDRYSYAWSTEAGVVSAGAGPTLSCEVSGTLADVDVPEVAWRGGIDLNPLDVTDADAKAWLATLVWPEQDDRRGRLRVAIEVAAADPPYLVEGDLATELPALVDQASEHGPVVVFHSAVIAYLEELERRRFSEMMAELVADGRCHWVSNEGSRVLPGVTATASGLVDDQMQFVLGIDGRAVAQTHGHGRSMRWL